MSLTAKEVSSKLMNLRDELWREAKKIDYDESDDAMKAHSALTEAGNKIDDVMCDYKIKYI